MDAEQIEARLLELYYGLLSEQEAAELRERIASDAQWAEAWGRIEQLGGQLAEAARYPAPPVPLPEAEQLASEQWPPREFGQGSSGPQLLSESVRSGRTGGSPRGSGWAGRKVAEERWPLGVVYIGTFLLLLTAFWGATVHRHHLLALTGQHLRLFVQGPSVLRAGMENHFWILTSRPDGQPVEAQVELALFGPDEKRFFSQKDTTDAQGQVRVLIPSDMVLPGWVEMKVTAQAGSQQVSRSAYLQTLPAEYQSFLALDRVYYRPGDTVFFRSLTVERFSHRQGEDLWVEFELRDAEDRPVPGFFQQGRSWQGLGCGQFRLPGEMPSGIYTLVARNTQNRFPSVRKPFWVLPSPSEPLQLTAVFQQAPYRPGQKVEVHLELKEKGRPLPEQPVQLRVHQGSQTLLEQTLSTEPNGHLQFSFPLPDRLEEPSVWLWAKVPRSPVPVFRWWPIPLAEPKLVCRFYPEGGLLIPGVANRVYFAVRDPQGRPLEIRGQILDSHQREILQVHTTHHGRGVFQFRPVKNQTYQLRILSPEGFSQSIPLPPVVQDRKVIVKTGLGVIEPNRPIEFHLLTTPGAKQPMPLMAAVVCRGVEVARQWVVPEGPKEGLPTETPVEIPLPAGLWGLMHLRVYDYSQTPPMLVAQRLFYRLPASRLQAQCLPEPQSPLPGQSLQIRLFTKDPEGTPTTAVGTVAVVEEGFLGSFSALPVITPFWLLDELWELPEDLEEADFLVSNQPKAQQALDLLLGTWGGRVMGQIGTESPEESEKKETDLFHLFSSPFGSASVADRPPLVLDNLQEIQANYQQAIHVLQRDRPETLNAITLASLLGGIALVLFVILATLLQISGGLRLWLPACIGAGLCVGIGLVLAHPRLLRSSSAYAVPFREYPSPENTNLHSSSSSQAGSAAPSSTPAPRAFDSSIAQESRLPGGHKPSSSIEGPVPVGPSWAQALGLPPATSLRFVAVGAQEAQQLAHMLSSAEREDGVEPTQPLVQPSKTVAAGRAKVRSSPSQSLPEKTSRPARDHGSTGPSPYLPSPSSQEPRPSETLPLPGSRFVVREYLYRAEPSAGNTPPENAPMAPLLYWHPFFLIGPEGSAECRFDLPSRPGTFRIRADLQAPGGRMTLAETKLLLPPPQTQLKQTKTPPKKQKPSD